MKKISERIQKNAASDYDILLYVYIILTETHSIPTDEKVINGNILNSIIWNATKEWTFHSVHQGITYDKYEEVIQKFANDRYIDFNDKYPYDLYNMLIQKFIRNSYTELAKKISYDDYEKSADGIFHDAYEKEVQNTAHDIYKKLADDITNTKNISGYFERDKYKKLTEEIVKKKYAEFLQSFKNGRYAELSQKFITDTCEFLDKRFPCDKYEEFIKTIADDIFTKITKKITENCNRSIYRETVKNIVDNKYSEFVQIFESERPEEHLLRFMDDNGEDKHDKFFQRFVDDICGVLDKKFPLGVYENAIKNIADHVSEKLLKDITGDRKLIGHCRRDIYGELTEDIINDKYDELVHVFAHERHGRLAQSFSQDIYDKLIQKFADDRYDLFVREFSDDKYGEFITNIANDEYEEFIGMIAEDKTEAFAEYMIYVLYMWLADHGILVEYNSIIKSASADQETLFVPSDPTNIEDYDDAVKLWDECKESPSRYNYYYHKYPKRPNRNHDNLKDHFSGILSGMKKSACTFFPSFITLIINDLDPQKHNKSYECNVCDFPYDQYMPDLGYITNATKSLDRKNISIFLKLIIAYENFDYGRREQHDVETWFKEKKKELEIEQFDQISENYIATLNPEEQKLFRGLRATCDKKPDFYLSYFDIFLNTYRNQRSLIFERHSGWTVDLTLSLFHLNVFTRWYDAFLLIEGMPFEFLRYNSLYLKLLTIPFIKFEGYRFLDVVKELAAITDMDLKQAVISKDSMIKLEDIGSLFYRNSRKNICGNDLADIFDRNKNSIKRNIIKNINPIYKLIYLLDDFNLDNKRLDDLLYTDYQRYLNEYEAPSSIYGNPKIIKDSNPEYEDGYD